MAPQDTKRAQARIDQSIGTVYERLNQARQDRQKILNTPEAANTDRKASAPRKAGASALPRIKPQAPSAPVKSASPPWRFDWAANLALCLLILAVIVTYAVR